MTQSTGTHYLVGSYPDFRPSPPAGPRHKHVSTAEHLRGVTLGPHDAIRFLESARFLPEFDEILKVARRLEAGRAVRLGSSDALDQPLSFEELRPRGVLHFRYESTAGEVVVRRERQGERTELARWSPATGFTAEAWDRPDMDVQGLADVAARAWVDGRTRERIAQLERENSRARVLNEALRPGTTVIHFEAEVLGVGSDEVSFRPVGSLSKDMGEFLATAPRVRVVVGTEDS